MAEIIKTVEHAMETMGKKTYPITITKLRSKEPFYFDHNGKSHFVDAVTITDAGKYGTSTAMTMHQDWTEEERREGRKRIQETIAMVMRQNGLW